LALTFRFPNILATVSPWCYRTTHFWVTEHELVLGDLRGQIGSDDPFASRRSTCSQCPEWQLIWRGQDRDKTYDTFLWANVEATCCALLAGRCNNEEVSIRAMPWAFVAVENRVLRPSLKSSPQIRRKLSIFSSHIVGRLLG
jgi:hypothetical protein